MREGKRLTGHVSPVPGALRRAIIGPPLRGFKPRLRPSLSSDPCFLNVACVLGLRSSDSVT